MPKVAIAIKSCHKNAARRKACLDTWLPRIPAGWDFFFLVGRPLTLDDSTVLNCDVSDAFADIAPKIKCACEYARMEKVTNLLVCDDDTYLVPERAEHSLFENQEYMGHMRTDGVDYNKGIPYGQGSCYWLGSRAMEYIAKDNVQMVPGVIDDGAVGRVLVDRVPFVHDRRFYPGPHCMEQIPHATRNATISTHKCLPEAMYKVHEYYMRSLPR